MHDDRELIHRCARKESDALRELIQRYEPPLRGLLFRLLQREEDVEDVLCDVFIRLWRNASGFRGNCAPSTWIHRIAVTAATDVLRQRRGAERLFAPLEDGIAAVAPLSAQPEQTLLDREQDARCKALARAALACLPPEERIAATLHYLEGRSYQEVAAVTGVPVTTVRMRLFRARRRMEAKLRAWMEDDEIPRQVQDRIPCVKLVSGV
jgi:RNA polymerase sigma-70 factor (ECF subfamily)